MYWDWRAVRTLLGSQIGIMRFSLTCISILVGHLASVLLVLKLFPFAAAIFAVLHLTASVFDALFLHQSTWSVSIRFLFENGIYFLDNCPLMLAFSVNMSNFVAVWNLCRNLCATYPELCKPLPVLSKYCNPLCVNVGLWLCRRCLFCTALSLDP